MGPLNCFPAKFLLNVQTSGDHVHFLENLMDPLGPRDVLRRVSTFTKINLFLRLLSSLISIG
jgi:hypothetical protein